MRKMSRNDVSFIEHLPQSSDGEGFSFGEPCALGIDEAGRGPVMGPMVYGAAYWPLSAQANIEAECDFDDSKALTDEQREAMFEGIRADSRIGYTICTLSAECISAGMLQQDPISLNRMSHDAAIAMIHHAIRAGVNVAEIYVDTVGNAEYYQQKLTKLFGDRASKIIVCPKADSLYKVVSAASICAKVTRDRAMRDWVFGEECPARGVSFSPLECSGYPSDVRTKDWLRANVDPVFGYPNLIRFSWSTVRNDIDHVSALPQGQSGGSKLFEEGARNPFARVDWGDDASSGPTIVDFFGAKKKAKKSRGCLRRA